jgi:hypothetical protein
MQFSFAKIKKNVAQLLFYAQYRKKKRSCNLRHYLSFLKNTIMRTRITSLIAILTIAFSIPGMARQRIQVEAVNNDLSYYLDLKAIASIFGDSRDLEDFERRINDSDAEISNLDLNGDGDIDYLRVIETSENNTHVVVIQAILDRDVFQDVATVVVDRDRYRRSYVQIIGDPYIYGNNYIIEPVFYRTPRILSWFWTPYYRSWYSPYTWGYYPQYYHYRRPVHINIYLSHVHGCINYDHYYRYNDSWRNRDAYRMYGSISRNDYSVRYPERNYSRRNTDTSNRYEMDRRHNSDYVRSSDNNSSNNARYNSSRSSNNNVYDRSTRTPSDVRNQSGGRSESTVRKSETTRSSNTDVYRPSRQSSTPTREGYTPNQSSTRTEEVKRPATRSSENVTTPSRSSSESVRSARPAPETKTVERSSSQRSSTPAPTKSESTRSSSSKSSSSRSEGGRR